MKLATTREYKSRGGRTLIAPLMAHAKELLEDDIGWCLACANEQEGVEPDARKYTCDCCGENKVYGIEELFMMGVIK